MENSLSLFPDSRKYLTQTLALHKPIPHSTECAAAMRFAHSLTSSRDITGLRD